MDPISKSLLRDANEAIERSEVGMQAGGPKCRTDAYQLRSYVERYEALRRERETELERLVQLARDCGYATGHADSAEMLLREVLEQCEATRHALDYSTDHD